MRKKAFFQSGLFNPRALLAFIFCVSGLLLVMFGFRRDAFERTKAKAVSFARATTATATVGSPASALIFGPSTIADFQRVEGEPLNYIDKDGHYWISGPFGTTAQQSWIQRSLDNGDQFNLVSTTGLRPDAPPGGGDTDLTTDDQGNVYFIDLEALTNLGCSVSNDNGSTWRKNPECMQVPGVDRQWFATDNGSNHTIGAAGAADNTIFAQTNNQAVGSVIYSSPGSTGPTDAVGGFVYTSATSEPTGAAPGGSGQIKFDPVNRNLYMPDSTSTHVILSKAHVNVGQRTGLSFTTSPAPNSPDGGVSGVFVDLAVDKAGNVYAVWSGTSGNVYYTATTDQGATWTAPKQVNSAPAVNNTFTWAAAGANGNLVVIWLGTDMAGDPNDFPSWYNDRVGATGVKWYGYAAAIQNATSANPPYPDSLHRTPMVLWPDLHWRHGLRGLWRRPLNGGLY